MRHPSDSIGRNAGSASRTRRRSFQDAHPYRMNGVAIAAAAPMSRISVMRLDIPKPVLLCDVAAAGDPSATEEFSHSIPLRHEAGREGTGSCQQRTITESHLPYGILGGRGHKFSDQSNCSMRRCTATLWHTEYPVRRAPDTFGRSPSRFSLTSGTSCSNWIDFSTGTPCSEPINGHEGQVWAFGQTVVGGVRMRASRSVIRSWFSSVWLMTSTHGEGKL